MLQRRKLVAALASAALLPSGIHGLAGAQSRPAEAMGGELWFDPTQLPSFTGTVERYLLNPNGEVDALLFREGPQISFPPEVADELRRAVAPGRPLIVWGIRARNAPVITMLAFAPSAETTPMVLDRFYWRPSNRSAGTGGMPLPFFGTVRSPFYAPQGAVVGVVLDDGSVVLFPRGTASSEAIRSLLKSGTRIAVSGIGFQSQEGQAVLAEQFGEPGSLRPVTKDEPGPPAGAPGAARGN
ncbi:hypothetical protein [Roseomonas xinghualingensis]|uniref:hypothetical protein n=1 Tax=Roseomonas xinghualingensis TaxID=2986475 RepID=UPI0021F18345|nr:hypothetical protein [Roseomonas sp. SXEYE001]MCV4209081.1 hypothetical protein [Roseomonas sp. SXEYE001]